MNSYQRIYYAAEYGNVYLLLRKSKVVSEELNERITVIRSKYENRILFTLNSLYIILNFQISYKNITMFTEPSLLGSLLVILSRFIGIKSIIDIWDIPFRCKNLTRLNRLKRFVEIRIGSIAFKFANLYLVMITLNDYELKKFRLNREKIIYFNNAVRSELMKGYASKTKFTDFSIIMQRSYYTYGYGFELMIEAFDLISRQINAKLIIIGIINKELEKYLESSSFQNDIVCTGFIEIEKCWEYISKSHIAVIPFPKIIDLEQVLPIKAIEYLALGKAIVYTDLFGLKKIIGEDGYCVENITPIGIANAILGLYNNASKLEEYEIRAIERAKNYNAKDKHKKLFSEIQNRIVNKN